MEELLAPEHHLHLRLSTDDYAQLKAVAQAQGMTPVALVHEAIEIVIEDAPAPQVERTINPFIEKARARKAA
ncbi:MAG: hypothetical protein QOG70_2964 [Solirubrobacteraceae bacterium]|nr:hypothetical protein [Solirubrobacteraceae bacterium]